eukprot:XP_001690397.1 predicted protein [Chlamydomonas reinhardtii]
MKFVSWLVGSKPKSPELKEAEAAFSETERKDIEAHYNVVYKQFQAAYLGGRGAAPKGLDARHLGLLVGPLWGCLEPLLAADVFTLLASPDDGLVHLEQLLITKAKLERLGEDACLDTTFRMLDVHREGELRADALAAGMVSGLGKLSVSATLLQPMWMWLLSARLPPAQRCEWRLLFSSARDGKSFNTFFGRVSATPGPTLLLIRDKCQASVLAGLALTYACMCSQGGALFGGYASQPWAKSGNFYGDVSCAIFSLLPAVQVYPATGINDNIQWCIRDIPDQPS